MKLRTRFRLSAVVSLGAILALGLAMGWSVVEARRAARRHDLAGAVLREAFERGQDRDEYLMLEEPRARAEWEAKTELLRHLLRQGTVLFEDAEERALISQMVALVERGAGLFTETAALAGQHAGDDRLSATSPLRRAIGEQPLVAPDLNARARGLAASATARFDTTQQRMTLLLLVLLAGVFAVTLGNARLSAAALERRLDRLRAGAGQVASGDLVKEIGLAGDDELAELGRAFDHLTARLRASHASLESEVLDRKRAQDEVGRLNEELRRHVAALETSNRELEAFSYAVSHDLRAPLRSVSGFSQAALEDYGPQLDAQGKQYLELAAEGAREMGQLIDDLLGLSRVARVDMVWQPVDLSALAEEVVAELRRAEPARKVEISIAPGLTVEGHPTLLRLALENLLRNAWKFTSRHPTAHVTFGRAPSEGPEAFQVADDGAGFDMAYVDRLFRPFQRLHRSAEFPGTGIGLATVSRIILRHGGKVEARGEVEKGATFTFTLPHGREPHVEQDHPAGRG